MDKGILQEAYRAQAKTLVEFGYQDVTASMVEEAHRKWRAGTDASGIVEMFCFSAFEDHERIFGKRGAGQ